jgi:hypothetical protein
MIIWDTPDMLDKGKENHLPYFELTRTKMLRVSNPRTSGTTIQLSKSFGTSYWIIDQFSTSEVRIPKIASIRRIRTRRRSH